MTDLRLLDYTEPPPGWNWSGTAAIAGLTVRCVDEPAAALFDAPMPRG